MRKESNLIFLFFTTIILCVFSCGDLESIHEEYLGGEEVYAGKLDTLKVRPGYYRAQLEGQTQFLGNSNQIIIEYCLTLQIANFLCFI